MTTITPTELAGMRRKCARKFVNRGYGKPAINAGLQAIEDWMVSGATVTPTTSLFAAIDVATTPLGFTFNNAERKALFAYWCDLKFRKDG